MNDEDKFEERVRLIHSRVLGIKKYLEKEGQSDPRREVADKYEVLLTKMERCASDDDLSEFRISTNAFYSSFFDSDAPIPQKDFYCYRDLFLPQVIDFIRHLEVKYPFLSWVNLPAEVRFYLPVRDSIVRGIKKE